MKKVLNALAKIGMEVFLYLFEHIFLVIGIVIILVLLIAKLQQKNFLKKLKKKVAFCKMNWYIKSAKWISDRTKVHVAYILNYWENEMNKIPKGK